MEQLTLSDDKRRNVMQTTDSIDGKLVLRISSKVGVSAQWMRELLPQLARDLGETPEETARWILEMDVRRIEQRRREWYDRYG